MITAKKLRAALDRIEGRTGNAHGGRMSGLSIPGEYYLGRGNHGTSKAPVAKPRSNIVAGFRK
jgi:hypothetical protein